IVFTQVKHSMEVLRRPFPKMFGSWAQPAWVTAEKHGSPSDTTTVEGARFWVAHPVSSWLLNASRGENTAYTPTGIVQMTFGTLPAAPTKIPRYSNARHWPGIAV
ncbi:MAG: hypothetical protein P1P84_25875, partial [Deferrisomatales bacterium]|nr:hypothetical protein [Deferrisomatales bacterium]